MGRDQRPEGVDDRQFTPCVEDPQVAVGSHIDVFDDGKLPRPLSGPAHRSEESPREIEDQNLGWQSRSVDVVPFAQLNQLDRLANQGLAVVPEHDLPVDRDRPGGESVVVTTVVRSRTSRGACRVENQRHSDGHRCGRP